MVHESPETITLDLYFDRTGRQVDTPDEAFTMRRRLLTMGGRLLREEVYQRPEPDGGPTD